MASLPARTIPASAILLLAALVLVTWFAPPAQAATTTATVFRAAQDRPPRIAPSRVMRVEFGTVFATRSRGSLTGLRLYRAPGRTGVHVARFWNGSGRLLAARRFRPQRGSGWQVARFVRPVPVRPGVRYVVSIASPSGFHARTMRGFRAVHMRRTVHVPRGGGGVVRRGFGFPARGLRSTNYWVDPIVVIQTGTTTPTPTTGDPQPGVPAPVTPGSTIANPAAGYPNAASTGVPAGTLLQPHTSPCTITVDNTVIDSRHIQCDLRIQAANVLVRRSLVSGTVTMRPLDHDGSGNLTLGDFQASPWSMRFEDSEIDVGARAATGIGRANYDLVRVEVRGGTRNAMCDWNCEIHDSYLHGQMPPAGGQHHMSSIRMSQNLVLSHSTVSCDGRREPPELGCSASLTGYGDWAPVQNNLIVGNIFYGSDGGQATFCVRGGAGDATDSKPYADQTRDIRFISNVFVRGTTGQCGILGSNASFDASKVGNVWRDNVWDDGTCVPLRGLSSC